VAVDMSLPLTSRLLELGEGLRRSVGARLHLVHSLPYKKAYYSMEEGSLERRSAREARDVEVRSVMQELRAILGDAIDHWEIQIGEGPVVADLGQVVEHRGIDLLVMGSVSRTGVPGLIVGNTAESVFARIDCPLWVIKPEGWVSPVPREDDHTKIVEKMIR
jgi:nucleotide-binding universal stress UspA family protein